MTESGEQGVRMLAPELVLVVLVSIVGVSNVGVSIVGVIVCTDTGGC